MSTTESFEFGNDNEEQDNEFISQDDVQVQRDETGEIVPVVKEVPRLGGKAKVRPMTYGKVQRLFGDGPVEAIEPETIVEVLNDHVLRPDMSDMTLEDIEESMKPLAPNFLLMAVFDVSGISGEMRVDEDGEPEMELELGNG